ncbi:TolC family protein [Hymenobacter sp. BT770]|uniref:TolC family protein n=1 Tax=Hymenobacter sp. BT770 TaxID=2886942 RepID=UPI001D106A0F|nr:TolC family protein [Hymenobacter sp. BT770]MCC3154108.1 TolC family protein [Hymenobacter sp. BT770]MDO3416252.1 TolC family protein [Hymenobacter sp. BT770]
MSSPFSSPAAVVFALALLSAGSAAAQTAPAADVISDSLTLDGTLRSVLEANPGVTSLTELANAASGRLAQTRTGFLPQITGTATYTRIDPVVKLPFGGETLQLAPNNNYDAHITAQYLLLDFGKSAATVKVAESQVQTAQDNVNVARRDLAFNAAQVYYNILFMRESIKVQDAQIASLQAHRNEMEKRVQGGVSTRFDVTTTDVRITQAQNTKIDLQNQLRNQQVQLARLLHKPTQADIPVKGRLAFQPQSVNVDAELTKAYENRPEIKLARDAENTATLQQRLVERSNMPSLGIGAQVGAKNGYLPELNQIKPNTVGVVQLSVPIYDGNKNKNQRVEALANARSAVARTQDTQEQIRADVRQAANNMEFSQARYDNAERQIAQATDALTRARARYRYDVGTNLDVLDAETQLAQARLARAQAIYNYTLGQFQLKRATGEQIWQ